MIATKVEIIGFDRVYKSMAARAANLKAKLRNVVQATAYNIERRAKFNVSGNRTMLGRTLHQTGLLERSIKTKFYDGGMAAEIGTNLKYAAIHEFGGITGPHVITPRNRKMLGWGGTPGSREHFAKRVDHPGSRIPARPYLRPALNDYKSAFIKAIQGALAGTP